MLCTTVRPAEVVMKFSSCKSQLKKVLEVQDTDKSPNPVATGLHVGSEVGKEMYLYICMCVYICLPIRKYIDLREAE